MIQVQPPYLTFGATKSVKLVIDETITSVDSVPDGNLFSRSR